MESRKLRPQDRYDEKNGLKTCAYKLKADVAEAFKEACKKKGVSIGPTLTMLMQSFIDEVNGSNQ